MRYHSIHGLKPLATKSVVPLALINAQMPFSARRLALNNAQMQVPAGRPIL